MFSKLFNFLAFAFSFSIYPEYLTCTSVCSKTSKLGLLLRTNSFTDTILSMSSIDKLGLEKILYSFTDCEIFEDFFLAKTGLISSGLTLVFLKKETNESVDFFLFSTLKSLLSSARPKL